MISTLTADRIIMSAALCAWALAIALWSGPRPGHADALPRDPPAVVPDPLGLGPTAVPHAWWGTEPLDAYASMGIVPPLVEPPLCGRFGAPGTYRTTPTWVFAGAVQDCDGEGCTGELSVQRGDDAGTVRGWQVLAGPALWTGATRVIGPAVLTVPPTLASRELHLGRRSLLCVSGWSVETPASVTTGANLTAIDWTAVTPGAAGNGITVQIIATATAGATATCTVTGAAVTVTRLSGASVGTVAEAASAGACGALVSAVAAVPATVASLAVGPVALTGGSDPTGAYAADWTPAAGTTVTWSDPPAVLHVAGAITDASRLSLTVEQAPNLYPTPILEADGGIVGTPIVTNVPNGWRIRQTATTLYLEPVP